MDKDALENVVGDAIRQSLFSSNVGGYARAAFAALGANGYVVVPRHLLDELTEHYRSSWHSGCNDCIQVSAAVVEAVGPTT